jgi:hypothetical protein
MSNLQQPKNDEKRINELRSQFNEIAKQAKKEGFSFFATIYFLTDRDKDGGFSSNSCNHISGLTINEFTSFLTSVINNIKIS